MRWIGEISRTDHRLHRTLGAVRANIAEACCSCVVAFSPLVSGRVGDVHETGHAAHRMALWCYRSGLCPPQKSLPAEGSAASRGQFLVQVASSVEALVIGRSFVTMQALHVPITSLLIGALTGPGGISDGRGGAQSPNLFACRFAACRRSGASPSCQLWPQAARLPPSLLLALVGSFGTAAIVPATPGLLVERKGLPRRWRQMSWYELASSRGIALGVVGWAFVPGHLLKLPVLLLSLSGSLGLVGLNHHGGSTSLWMSLVVISVLLGAGFAPTAAAYLADQSQVLARDCGLVMGFYSVLLKAGSLLGSTLGGIFSQWRHFAGLSLFTLLFAAPGMLSLARLMLASRSQRLLNVGRREHERDRWCVVFPPTFRRRAMRPVRCRSSGLRLSRAGQKIIADGTEGESRDRTLLGARDRWRSDIKLYRSLSLIQLDASVLSAVPPRSQPRSRTPHTL